MLYVNVKSYIQKQGILIRDFILFDVEEIDICLE